MYKMISLGLSLITGCCHYISCFIIWKVKKFLFSYFHFFFVPALLRYKLYIFKVYHLIWYTFWFFKKYILKIFYLFVFRQREGKKKERERNINVWLPLQCPLLETCPTTQECALTGNRTNDPFGSQAGAQSTGPYQSGLIYILK